MLQYACIPDSDVDRYLVPVASNHNGHL